MIFNEDFMCICIVCGPEEKKQSTNNLFLFQIRTPFNYLLMNMILAETLIAMFGIPIDTVATYQRGWKLGKELCLATGFVLTTLGKNIDKVL